MDAPRDRQTRPADLGAVPQVQEEVREYPKPPTAATDEDDLEREDSKSSVESALSSSEFTPHESSNEFSADTKSAISSISSSAKPEEKVTVNDTLKVIFVGMALAGKTSMIKRLIEGRDAVIPKRDERTVGVDIYEWDPKKDEREEIRHIDTRIDIQDKELAKTSGDVNVKFSVWDFAGQQEGFFPIRLKLRLLNIEHRGPFIHHFLIALSEKISFLLFP